MFKKILIPLDGSGLGEQALQPALKLAHEANSEAIFLSVSERHPVVAAEPAGAGVHMIDQPFGMSPGHLKAYLQAVRNKVPAFQTVKIMVEEGDAAGAIVDTAVHEDVDLIVMSTHGHSGLSRWVMGSVSERVMRHAPCPVLIIREAVPLAKIAITVDGSKLSEFALEPGVEIAKHFGSQVTLLRVEQPELVDPTFIVELDRIEPGMGDSALEGYHYQVENYLKLLAEKLQAKVETPIILASGSGGVAPTILNHVETNDIDLIVIATHGRTGLSRWRYGSIAEKVLRGASCALLVIRPPLSELE